MIHSAIAASVSLLGQTSASIVETATAVGSGTVDSATINRVTFEWGRIQSSHDWLLPGAVFTALVMYTVFMYRKDSAELNRAVGLLLTLLRVATFAGLLIVYLQPQWRNEHQRTDHSRVALVVDGSLSMQLPGVAASGDTANTTRADQVVASFKKGELLNQLRRNHDVSVFRFDQAAQRVATLPRLSNSDDSTPATAIPPETLTDSAPVDWQTALAASGLETHLGDTLRRVLTEQGNDTLSAIVVISDGQHNAGLDAMAAVKMAADLKIPIHTVGLGSDKRPAELWVNDFQAPQRAYPGDNYTATGYLQAHGLSGQTVKVELFSRDGAAGAVNAAPGNQPTGTLEGTQNITLGADGEAIAVKFELTPQAIGQRVLTFKVTSPPQDGNTKDNQEEARVEIVDRKSRVLLFASGPTREYQFLRNLLKRDRNTLVDVRLQTSTEGISQDANAILDHFPSTADELFEYDTIVAFDPDWRELDAGQVALLERWVGEQAGGLITVAGPIFMGVWSSEASMTKLRGLYPVEFNRRFAVADDGEYGSLESWPIEFTRDGQDAEFLWIENSAAISRKAWSDFRGVFGYYAVRGPKPGATVYGRFADPAAADGENKPVYMAGHIYGSGRVFYLGSGEIWRLRSLDDAYFDRFYTKLIRFVSQGRLLRGSNRGVLLVEREDYALGATVEIRAQLSNAQLEPLVAEKVDLRIIAPDGTNSKATLTPDPSRAGAFRGQFAATQEGQYRLELPIADSDERLTSMVRVKLPDLENENRQRNDALLSEMARQTGGTYTIGLEPLTVGADGRGMLASKLEDRSQTVTMLDAPRRLWDNQGVLFGLCGMLCLEWLIRRLAKLA